MHLGRVTRAFLEPVLIVDLLRQAFSFRQQGSSRAWVVGTKSEIGEAAQTADLELPQVVHPRQCETITKIRFCALVITAPNEQMAQIHLQTDALRLVAELFGQA